MRSYLRLLRFAAPYKLTLAAAIACMAVLSLSTAAYVYMLGPTLEFLFRGDPNALAGLGRFLPASWDLAGKLARLDRSAVLAVLPAIIVGLAAVKGVAYFGQFYLMGMVGQRMVADVGRATDVRAYVDATIERWDTIDVLFSNAGNAGVIAPLAEYPEEVFDDVWRVHVKGAFLALALAICSVWPGFSRRRNAAASARSSS